MLELEEIIKSLNELNSKLKNLGESLWHFKYWQRIKKLRRRKLKNRIFGILKIKNTQMKYYQKN